MSGSEHERESEPARLSEGASGDPVLDELGRWFGAVPPARGLEQAALARVGRRLAQARSKGRARWRRSPVTFALIGLTSGAAAMWAHHSLTTPPVAPAAPSALAAPAARAPGTSRATRALHPSPELPASPESASSAEPASRPTESTASARGASPDVALDRVARDGASSTRAAPVASSDLARESAALERALTALRREHDPAGALALLDRYAADFPAGVLRLEAEVARVDAELALGRSAQALAILERLPLERVGRGLELRLVRAELLAPRDCRRASLDFERVLASNPPPALDERALFGRASCRLRSGDVAGGQADLGTYLARYPDGRFAKQARERLGSRPGNL